MAVSLAESLALWDRLTLNVKQRLPDLPHLAPIVKELDALICEGRAPGADPESSKEGLVPGTDRPPRQPAL